jgi:hypothetical protein
MDPTDAVLVYDFVAFVGRSAMMFWEIVWTTGTVVVPGTVTVAVMTAVPAVVVGRNLVTNCPPAGVVPMVSWRLQGWVTLSTILAFPMALFVPSVTMTMMFAESVLPAATHKLELVITTFTGLRAAAVPTKRRILMNRMQRRFVSFPPLCQIMYFTLIIYKDISEIKQHYH